jgi:hypothetical protein
MRFGSTRRCRRISPAGTLRAGSFAKAWKRSIAHRKDGTIKFSATGAEFV